MDLKGSRTEKNLMEAFAGESQARNKYTYFAGVARKEGYEKVAAVFQETADNEKEHAKLELRYLNGIGNTAENLKAAAEGENAEHTSMYPEFARVAREEGFEDIADMFERIARVEADHERKYRELLALVESKKVFERDEKIKWRCRNCGYVHEGNGAPAMCPLCKHPQGFFENYSETY